MTQRTFSTDEYRVVTGWDRPLQYHFLDIYPRHALDRDEAPLFSNLEREDPAMSLEEIDETLHRYGITAPPGLLQDLADDQALNRGNLEVSYGATTFGRSDESPGEGNTVISRLEELADKIRDFFSRTRQRDQGMDL